MPHRERGHPARRFSGGLAVTEVDRLTSDNPVRMFDAISNGPSRRKCLLYVVGCLNTCFANHGWTGLDPHLDCVERWADGADNLQEVRGIWATQTHFNEESIRWCYRMLYISARVGDEALPTEATTALLRELLGNPFRAVAVDSRWQSEAVVALATGIYTERAFDRMPILADALEDAGCDNADILAHCRGDGPHVRGCWVVDLILGKS
jgi:hypothetical protein